MELLKNILLEGTDCVGKSSIVKELTQFYELTRTYHFQNPKDKEDGKRQYEEAVKLMNSNSGLIFDRAFLGEAVYAPVFRNYYPEYLRNLEEKIQPHNYLFVITAREEKIKERFDGKFINLKQIPIISNAFLEEFNLCKMKNKFIIDTSDISAEEAAKKIISILEGGR